MHKLPLEELSIAELFNSAERVFFEIPIYQRNYAWEEEQITTLVKDVNDAFTQGNAQPYYIGTLVSYNKGDNVYEVIDGQQRLTTIWLILAAMNLVPKNTLTYRARKKSAITLNYLAKKAEENKEWSHNTKSDGVNGISCEEKDLGIDSGFESAQKALAALNHQGREFKDYFLNKVKIIHYQVPKNIDLNHYFEVMNSRGEQLEQHEIVKARLMSKLDCAADQAVFSEIWNACSQMNSYLQKNISNDIRKKIFTENLSYFKQPINFDDLRHSLKRSVNEEDNIENSNESCNSNPTIASLIDETYEKTTFENEDKDYYDDFQKIIDFPNFLLIVLRLYNKSNGKDEPLGNDKDLIKIFNESFLKVKKPDEIKKFALTLLKAKFFLDTFIVHHSREDETRKNNPWTIQKYAYEVKDGKSHTDLKNLSEAPYLQLNMVQVLSMFEVTYSSYQGKNYLFYCLQFLFDRYSFGSCNEDFYKQYQNFLDKLADKYFFEFYLNCLNRSFDKAVSDENVEYSKVNAEQIFKEKYFNGEDNTNKQYPPLFIFNYLDYKIWKLYAEQVRGKTEEGENVRKSFITTLGCREFKLDYFNNFYFSRTRNSLEHFFPQANATDTTEPSKTKINCLGNYAMIGREANSSGSNWTPGTKIKHYVGNDQKVNPVSVSSLKFLIMMQICKENDEEWGSDQITDHQSNMINILFN